MGLSQRGYFAKGDQKMAGDGYDFLNNVAILDDRNIEDGVCAVTF